MGEENTKILVVVALDFEANPIKKQLNLKRNPEHRAFPVYQKDEIILVVSGMGKVKSAAATAYVAAHEQNSVACFLNFGIAGAIPNRDVHIGDLVLANKVRDHATGREFYPDMLVKHSFKEEPLETFDHVVTEETANIPASGLVDMEASGFFEAATAFAGPHTIQCLKAVSDFLLSDGDLVIPQIEEMLFSHVNDVFNFVDKLVKYNQSSPSPALPPALKKELDALAKVLNLTATQVHQLHNGAMGYFARHGSLDPGAFKSETAPSNSRQRNERFDKIKQFLSS